MWTVSPTYLPSSRNSNLYCPNWLSSKNLSTASTSLSKYFSWKQIIIFQSENVNVKLNTSAKTILAILRSIVNWESFVTSLRRREITCDTLLIYIDVTSTAELEDFDKEKDQVKADCELRIPFLTKHWQWRVVMWLFFIEHEQAQWETSLTLNEKEKSFRRKLENIQKLFLKHKHLRCAYD